jgi:indole-3-glycerol phosphate synthase
MSNILDKIAQSKREYVAQCKKLKPISELEAALKYTSEVRGFQSHLEKALSEKKYGLIAEIKKASPSKGMIRQDFDPPSLATAYEEGGASCISVLTDEPYFKGCDQFLIEARASTTLPVLRKDFMIDPYQIIEARAMNADCILLIMALLDDYLAAELEQTALENKLDVLVEVHNIKELERAHNLKSRLLGINNRNLKTFDLSLDTTVELSRIADKNKILVSESGLFTHQDLKMLNETCGINNFLIGEALMRQDDVTAATKKLLFNDRDQV